VADCRIFCLRVIAENLITTIEIEITNFVRVNITRIPYMLVNRRIDRRINPIGVLVSHLAKGLCSAAGDGAGGIDGGVGAVAGDGSQP
jgi:hypothetical protein